MESENASVNPEVFPRTCQQTERGYIIVDASAGSKRPAGVEELRRGRRTNAVHLRSKWSATKSWLGLLTFVDELVMSEETLSRSGVVRLEDEFDRLVDGDHRTRRHSAAQAVFEVLHLIHVDREDVDVVEETSEHIARDI